MSISRIEVTFPLPIELPKGFEQRLDALLQEVCDVYNAAHPERIMWMNRAMREAPLGDSSDYVIISRTATTLLQSALTEAGYDLKGD